MIQASLLFLALALPPQVEITSKGTKITQGQISINVLPDGSILIKSPSVNLVLPSDQSIPVIPVDDLSDAVKAIYGGIQEPTKAADALALARSYRAVNWNQVTTVGDLANSLRGVVPATRFAPVRERTSREVLAVFGDDPEQQITNDMKDKGRVLFTRIATILEECANGR
jgi:hypothetical protein